MAINQQSINQGALSPTLQGQGSLSLNGFSMCSEWIGTSLFVGDRSYNNKIESNGWVDGGYVVSHLLQWSEIAIDFHIRGADKVDLQKKIDRFKWATARKNMILTTNVGDDIRKMRVNTTETRLGRRGFGSLIQSGTISFEAVDPPRARSQNVRTKAYSSITWDFSGEVNNFGNANAYPVYLFIFNTANISELTWTVNGYPVKITEAITDGDILTISADLYQLEKKAGVYINGSPVDFDGQVTVPLYPEEYGVENNTIWLSLNNGATCECDISILFHEMRE